MGFKIETDRHILIVEDDPDIAGLVELHMSDQHFRTHVVADGKDGLREALTGKYDLIIQDLMLPGMDGMDVCRKIREEKLSVPILMLTARSDEMDKILGLELGADDYLTKPFAFSELKARIEALLRRSQSTDLPVTELAVEDLTMDLLRRTVSRGEAQIDLQPREFRLLEYLMRHAGQVVTRTMLLEQVWDYHFDPQTNVIDVHISRLRGKIDKGFDKTLLETVRGAGYRLG